MLLPHLHVTKHEQPAVNRTPGHFHPVHTKKKDTWEKREEEVGFNVYYDSARHHPSSYSQVFPMLSHFFNLASKVIQLHIRADTIRLQPAPQ